MNRISTLSASFLAFTSDVTRTKHPHALNVLREEDRAMLRY